jgi:drug/metabolite transporter (DMT)-like permease
MESTPATTVAVEQPREERLAYAGLGLSALGWASAFIIGKVVLAELAPLPVGALRYGIAAAVLLPFALRRRPGAGLRRALVPLAIMVVCGGVAYQWLFLLALARTTATNTSLLVALNPVFTVLLAPLVGESLSRERLAGVGLALSGAVVVITHGDVGVITRLAFNTGDVLALVAAVNWAAFNLAARRTVGRLTPAFTNCVIYGIGGTVMLLLALPSHPFAQYAAASWAAIGGVAAMAGLSSVLAGQLFLVGVRVLGVTRTVVFIYLVPVLTALLSATLLGEPFGAAQAAGGAAVLAGVYWSTRPAARTRGHLGRTTPAGAGESRYASTFTPRQNET